MAGNDASDLGILEYVGSLVSDPEGIVVCERSDKRRVIPFGEIRRVERGRTLLSSFLGAVGGAVIGGIVAPQPFKVPAAIVGLIIGGIGGVKIAEVINEWCRRHPCACYRR